MMYHSTRGGGKRKTFEEVLVSTYAEDGGLYVPEKLPMISATQLASWSKLPFPEICARVLQLFSGIDLSDLISITRTAFKDFNDGKEPLPMTKIGNFYLLDASLGPTFAFKDVGQQVIGQLLNYILAKRGEKAKILVETSGDTGPAAIAGVKNCPHVEIFCLYPNGRVSSVQELQMISVQNSNVHVYRTEGDCDEQASVLKEIFSDQDFVGRNNICSVNSINWMRIAAQSSYYVWAYLQLVDASCIGSKVNFIIPTGAFGNAMGGFLAKKMGLPINKIVCATNANDIVHRVLSSGDMNMGANVQVVYRHRLYLIIYYFL
jgi:threonine synthase